MPSSHFDRDGNAHMVDVSAKAVTRRVAVATSTITMNQAAATQIRQGSADKGDVLAVARLAGIGGAKWTAHLIPLCHAIPIESVAVAFRWLGSDDGEDSVSASHHLLCEATCRTSGKTGIEMEALTAASIAALTVFDMLKSVDRQMVIGPTRLEHKSGGQSGDFQRK